MQPLDTLYRQNLEIKTQWMIAKLEGIGCSHLRSKIIPSPLSDGFRNRAKFRVFHSRNRIRVEGTSPRGGPVAYEKSLWIIPDWCRRVVRQVIAFIQENRRDFVVDGFEIQLTHGKKNIHITFSVSKSIIESYEDSATTLLAKIPEITGVAVPSQKLEVGETFLVHSIGDKDFQAHYASFFQSNLHLTPELAAHVGGMSTATGAPQVFDLFCGVGLMSLSIGGKNINILGVDTNRMAIESAKINASRMGFRSARYSVSSVERFVLGSGIKAESLVLINPPRSGCAPTVIDGIASHKPIHVILVSCSLKTHVLDLARLKKNGYAILSFVAYDMFPFTDFLETVTVTKRKV